VVKIVNSQKKKNFLPFVQFKIIEINGKSSKRKISQMILRSKSNKLLRIDTIKKFLNLRTLLNSMQNAKQLFKLMKVKTHSPKNKRLLHLKRSVSTFLPELSMTLRVKPNMTVQLKKIKQDRVKTLEVAEIVELNIPKKKIRLKRSIGQLLLNNGDNQSVTYVHITLSNTEEFFNLFVTC
jgi:transcription elongation GreA/GreB family factor